jgi:hypothetical protein
VAVCTSTNTQKNVKTLLNNTKIENNRGWITMQRDKNSPNTGNPAADDFLDWMASPYGQLSSEMLENVWDALSELMLKISS